MASNCFVCTLGQAQYHGRLHVSNISELLEKQAREHGQLPAVGFPDLAESSADVILSFCELNEQSKTTARRLVRRLPDLRRHLGNGCTAALLAHSHVHFLKIWLALVRLGFPVLILATQLDQDSIEQLCVEEKVEYMFHDNDHAGKAKMQHDLAPVRVVIDEIWDEADGSAPELSDPELDLQLGPHGHVPPVSFFHHSSGTSCGKAKAIPQPNSGAVNALPFIDHSPRTATFSSTSLSLAGGTADCLRAWSSAQMIWLFPAGQKPITAQNILKCLSVADESTSRASTPSVRYFSSVPFVLQDLAGSEQGVQKLRSMDIVGVGGAALPSSVGQDLIKQGVHLVSRYGSAECGFLLSSYRDFEKDRDWDYLRSDLGAKNLSFEPQANGLFELVANPSWPQITKTNRPDGSFASADLFEKHPTTPNAWRFHSRADGQIALTNGKKFDPQPIESELLMRCRPDRVSDILIFGDGESHPGALIFTPESSIKCSATLLDQIWPKANATNQQNPAHAHLSKHMLKIVVVRSEHVSPLEKTSKGTVMRTKAVEKYHHHIRRMYEGNSSNNAAWGCVNDKLGLVTAITHVVEDTTAKRLTRDDDFFQHGIDSIACVQIMKALQANIVMGLRQSSTDDPAMLPRKQLHGNFRGGQEQERNDVSQRLAGLRPNLLYDCATINNLANFLIDGDVVQDDETRSMEQLATKYSRIDTMEISVDPCEEDSAEGMSVLLTGATGALGTHLLDTLRSRRDVKKIYCLVRARDASAAYQRVEKALRSKAKIGLASMSAVNKKVVCIPCKLAQSDLGLEASMLREIRSVVGLILHAAWAVNFTLKLRSFEFHLAGMQNLLSLGFAAAQPSARTAQSWQSLRRVPLKFAFCSSIASVLSHGGASLIGEEISKDPHDASPLGYSRSKWVAEAICTNAYRLAQEKRLPLNIEVLRIGQLCGDSDHGIWNRTEAWPLMLGSCVMAGCIPNLPNETLNWLPVNTAAKAVCEISFKACVKERRGANPPVYHIINPHSTPTWIQMIQWLQESHGDNLQAVDAAVWVRRLERALDKDEIDHPSSRLLPLWKDLYLAGSSRAKGVKKPRFTTKAAEQVSAVMRNVRPLSRDLVEKMWRWVRSDSEATTKRHY